MWKIERNDDFFRILDSKKDIAGYFEPDYGTIFPKEKEYEIIEQMHKNHEKITGGFLMVPMVKFGIFDNEENMNIGALENKIDSAKLRTSQWEKFLLETKKAQHWIRVSHTDQDMLSISFPVKFDSSIPLEKKIILKNLEPILDRLQKQGLL